MTDETTSEQLAEIEGQPEPVQVREGRWRTRGGQEFRVSPMPTDHWDFAPEYPWWDGHVTTWRTDGRFSVHQNAMDLVEYLGPIEPDKTQELPEYTPPEGWRVVRFGELLLPGDEIVQIDDGRRYPTHRIGDAVGPNQQYIRRIKPEPQAESHTEQQIEELRSEVSYVQNLLGTERRRVAELEELVASLRTINEGAEKAVSGAGVVNDSLRLQLAAVKSELVTQAETSRRLQIELDAAQQVPPAIADRFKEGWNQGTARAVESVLEWLQPIRAVDNEHLANETLQHLPQIMRHLTGLDSHAID